MVSEDQVAEETYKEVLSGNRQKFPKFFWIDDGIANLHHAKVVTRYLIEDILKWNRDDVIRKFSSELLKKYKLYGMLSSVFGNSAMSVLENAYPGEYDPKEMQETFARHDDKILEREKLRLRKICEGLSHDEIVTLYNNAFFVKNRFVSIIQGEKININKFQLLDAAFPGEFQECEFTVPKGHWESKKNRQKATLWLMEKVGTQALKRQHFTDNGLSTVLTYGNGLDNVICEALGVTQEQYHTDFYNMFCQCHNNGIDLFADLGVKPHVVHNWITKKNRPDFAFVVEHYFRLVELCKQTENSPEGLYQKILDGKISRFPSKYWKRENSYDNAARIIRYVVDHILHWCPAEVMAKLSYSVFKELKLDGMLYVLFQADREQAISNAYPNIVWNNPDFQDHCIRWLIDKTDKLVPSIKDFKHYRLHPILDHIDGDILVRRAYNIQNVDCFFELERFRVHYGFSVEKLADMVGISPATIYNRMNGSTKLSLETEIKIMQAIRNFSYKIEAVPTFQIKYN